ncbi:MAG TPA: pilus assembly protein PilM, partial [Polyangiaceae bacterium]
MARYIGIDIGTSQVRVAVLSTGYKRTRVEALQEVALTGAPSVDDAVASAARALLPHSDGVAAAIDGDSSFVHRLSLPATARKQLQEVLPFELEAQMPIDIAELVWDFRVLRGTSPSAPIDVMAAAARTTHVQARIDLIKRALGREPDRIGCGPLAMSNLALLTPELRGVAPIAIVDLGSRRTEVTVLQNGEASFVRTLSRGVAGLPDTAPALVSDLRQTLLAFLAVSDQPVAEVILIGGGANAAGADAYLAHQLGIPVRGLPALEVELATPELALALPRFGKAIALATGLTGKALDLNLRSGSLAYQRGYGILKEKAPLLSGLAAALAVSFVFSSWAELRGLGREHELLGQALQAQSQNALGEGSSDPERVEEL